jgi:hypothetical protein
VGKIHLEGKSKFDSEFDYCMGLGEKDRVIFRNALQYDNVK